MESARARGTDPLPWEEVTMTHPMRWLVFCVSAAAFVLAAKADSLVSGKRRVLPDGFVIVLDACSTTASDAREPGGFKTTASRREPPLASFCEVRGRRASCHEIQEVEGELFESVVPSMRTFSVEDGSQDAGGRHVSFLKEDGVYHVLALDAVPGGVVSVRIVGRAGSADSVLQDVSTLTCTGTTRAMSRKLLKPSRGI
jgi:hypothetical protein